MPRLADGFINELKDRIDLYDLVSRYVQLKKSGSSWVGLSPFSQEKTPSFYVHPEKGFFNCFSSGEKGDAITFVQKIENLGFQEAIEYLSKEFNFPIRYEKGGHAQPFSNSIRADLYALHELAKSWFEEQFSLQNKESSVARSYWLEEREFSLETAKRFGIGFAPTDSTALSEFLLKKGQNPQLLQKSGLFRQKQSQGKFISLFCGRLMIPIHEKLGRICGFTARKLSVTPEWGDKKSPKYVNSPETPIFLKGQLLFNLHLANKEISEERDFLLVEGQLDAIRCWEEGFKTVVAPQGTAFKDTQADLLRKSNPRRVVCLLDGDDAGKKAALSYVPIFLKAGLDARFATLPKDSDPDLILRSEGPEALSGIIREGIPIIDYVIEQKLGRPAQASPNELRKTSELLFEPLSELDSFVVKDGYLEQLARGLNLSFDSVKKDFSRFTKNRRPRRAYGPSENLSEKESSEWSQRLTSVEDDLLFTLLHDDRLASPLAHALDLAWLDLESSSGRVLAKILSETVADGPLSVPQMEDLLEDDLERSAFQKFLYQDTVSHGENSLLRLANQCLGVLFSRQSKRNEQDLLTLISDCSNDPDRMNGLRKQLKEIRSQRNDPPSLISSDSEYNLSHAHN